MPKYTDNEIAAALKKCRGMVYVASEQLGCAPITVRERVAKSEKLQAVLQAAKGLQLDTAELKLAKAIEKGDLGAIKYYLSTQGKDRGYTERMEHSGPDGKDIPFKVTEVVINHHEPLVDKG